MDKVRVAGALSVTFYIGLLFYIMGWIIWWGDTSPRMISIALLILGTPLLLPLRGILAGRDKAIIWGTLVSLLYMVHGGVIAWAEPDKQWFGLAEMALSLGYLFTGSFFVRWRAEAIAATADSDNNS